MEHKADRTIDVLSLDDNSLGQMKNTNRQLPALAQVADADPNANDILSGETGLGERGWKDGSPVPPLVSQNDTQERIIIWDTDAEGPEVSLEELELLERQEVEAYLVKGGKTRQYESVRGEGHMKGTTTSGCTTSNYSGSANSRAYQQNNNHWRTGGSVEELECAVAQSYSQSESLRKARSNSEGNVFASSSLSTVPNFSSSLASALDSACSPASQYVYPTSAQNPSRSQQHQPTRGPALEVDQNHNTMLPQGRPDAHFQGYEIAQSNANRKYLPSRLVAPKQRLEDLYTKTGDWRQDFSGRQQANGASGERKKSCNERVPPCRRQLVRPFLSEAKPEHTSWAPPDPAPQQALSSADSHHTSHNQHLVHRVTSHSNGSSQYPVQGSGSLKGKLSPAGPCSSLESKAPITPRLCRSPSGADSPPSPRDTGSPHRHVSTSPPKPPQRGYAGTAQAVASTTTSSNSLLRASVRTSFGTGIPTRPPLQDRPLPPPQGPQLERSSPPKCPPKPKTVRPKIITYVRKGPNPCVKPQPLEGTPHPGSTLPSRLRSYPNQQAPSEAKFRNENQESAGPVLSASNLLFDKYRQEMHKAQQQFNTSGVAGPGIKTPSYTVPHKQTSRADSFYGSLNSKYMPGVVSTDAVHYILEMYAVRITDILYIFISGINEIANCLFALRRQEACCICATKPLPG